MVSYQSSTCTDVTPSVMAQGEAGILSLLVRFNLSPSHAVAVVGKLVVVPKHSTVVTPVEETDTLAAVGMKVVSEVVQSLAITTPHLSPNPAAV